MYVCLSCYNHINHIKLLHTQAVIQTYTQIVHIFLCLSRIRQKLYFLNKHSALIRVQALYVNSIHYSVILCH